MRPRGEGPGDANVFGVSMGGFVDGDGQKRVLGLQGQIGGLEACLRGYIQRHRDVDVDGDEAVRHRVVVVGHSVGAYIGLEIVRRHQEWVRGRKAGRGFEVVGFVGLWPTVTHIAESERGKRVGVRCGSVPCGLLSNLMVIVVVGNSVLCSRDWYFGEDSPLHLGTISCDDYPSIGQVSRTICKGHCGLPCKPQWCSPGVVCMGPIILTRELMDHRHMARDEMLEIGLDRWDEDIWGTATSSLSGSRPEIVLLFGTNDHWVADHHRDDLMKIRGSQAGEENWRPIMVIDDTGIPHSFCISKKPLFFLLRA